MDKIIAVIASQSDQVFTVREQGNLFEVCTQVKIAEGLVNPLGGPSFYGDKIELNEGTFTLFWGKTDIFHISVKTAYEITGDEGHRPIHQYSQYGMLARAYRGKGVSIRRKKGKRLEMAIVIFQSKSLKPPPLPISAH